MYVLSYFTASIQMISIHYIYQDMLQILQVDTKRAPYKQNQTGVLVYLPLILKEKISDCVCSTDVGKEKNPHPNLRGFFFVLFCFSSHSPPCGTFCLTKE